MTVAVLGPEGTFSHELALLLFDEPVVLVPSLRRVFQEVVRGTVDRGLVPLENSEAGGVGATLDGLQGCAVFITAEAYLKVRHHLAAFGPPESLTTLYAHPQTHEQCSEFIEAAGLPVVHTDSNAASALAMLEHPGTGAIVSDMTAELRDLPIVRRDVQNSPHNTTRFIVISREPGGAAGCGKCSLLIDPREDRAGLLHDLLAVFARRGINLSRIESRPSKRGMGSYVFFVDIVMAGDWQEAVQELRQLVTVKELGCYRRMALPGENRDAGGPG